MIASTPSSHQYPFSFSDIQSWTGGVLANPEIFDEIRLQQILIDKPAPLHQADSSSVSFLFSKSFEKDAVVCQAGVLITNVVFVPFLQTLVHSVWRTTAILVTDNPSDSMAYLSEKFAQGYSSVSHLPAQGLDITHPHPGKDPRKDPPHSLIHPSAIIAPDCNIHPSVRIGPGSVIESAVVIESGSVLYPGCFIGPGVRIGVNTVLFYRVSVYEWTEIGNQVRIHAGSVIGSDGFGYVPKFSKIDKDKILGHQKIYHLGKVIIEDDVEIGANCTIDRATFGVTRISRGAKLDNLVHIGHNSTVQEGAILCGGTCLAGRAKVGKFAMVGGLSGIANDVLVGDGAKVGALTLVTKDVAPGGTAVGNPQKSYQEHFQSHALLSRLVEQRKKSRRTSPAQNATHPLDRGN